MKETTQTNLPTFPVELYGHSLKYEIECMLKIFLPAAVSGKIPPLCSKAAEVHTGRKQTDL